MRRLPIAPLLGLLVLTALMLLPLPAGRLGAAYPLLFRQAENAAHPLIFAVVALMALRYLRGRRQREPGGRRDYLQAWLICAFLGAATELAQRGVGRDASWVDFGNDLLGASAALLLHWRAKGSLPTLQRHCCLAAVVACVGLAFLPLSVTLAAYARRAAQLPLLWQQESWASALFTEEIAGDLAGVEVHEPWPDWRGYGALEVALENPGEVEISVTVRVHDKAHRFVFEDRYNESFKLAPASRRQLLIPLDRIRDAPATRQMDLAQIAGVVVFCRCGPGPKPFIVKNMQLRP